MNCIKHILEQKYFAEENASGAWKVAMDVLGGFQGIAYAVAMVFQEVSSHCYAAPRVF